MLQKMLNKVVNANLTVDGIFDAYTKKAVQKFEAKYFPSHNADGVMGKVEWLKLFSLYFGV